MNKDTALKLALAILLGHKDHCSGDEVIAAIKEALAEPVTAQQEPKWKSISEQDMDEIIEQRHFAKGYPLHSSDITCIEWFKMGARWAEAKLGERNQ